jgi:hypothetical protein
MITDLAYSNLVARMPRSIELIYPRDVRDVYCAYMGRHSDSASGGRRRCGAHTCQYEHWDDFAPSRSRFGLAAMPSYLLSGSRGPIPRRSVTTHREVLPLRSLNARSSQLDKLHY